jgi:predicted transcriptional regulator
MNTKTSAKEKAKQLKELREIHSETVEKTQIYLKEQQNLRKTLKSVMKNGPMTVPEIAAAADLPSEVVMWHVMAMKKYDLVTEVGQNQEYFQYALTETRAK